MAAGRALDNVVFRLPDTGQFVKLSEEAIHRCPWCYHDMREGQHGEQETTAAGVLIRCTFYAYTHTLIYSTRIIAIPEGGKV